MTYKGDYVEYTTGRVAIICITIIVCVVIAIGTLGALLYQSQENDKKNDINGNVLKEYKVDACNRIENETGRALCIVGVGGKP